MNCPVCNTALVEKNFGVRVDVCENGCKGIWFDIRELQLLDEHNEGLGDALEAALRHPRDNKGKRGQIKCPKCDIPLHTHKYKRAKEVDVDECYMCGGFFLDSGELTDIRDHYMTDAELKTYVDQLLNAVPEYGKALEELEAEKKRVGAVEHFTRFLTVNYWRKKFSD